MRGDHLDAGAQPELLDQGSALSRPHHHQDHPGCLRAPAGAAGRRGRLHRPVLFPAERPRPAGEGPALLAQGGELSERRPHHPQHAQAAARPGQGAPGPADGDRPQLPPEECVPGHRPGRHAASSIRAWPGPTTRPSTTRSSTPTTPNARPRCSTRPAFKPGPDGTRFTLRLSFDTGRPEYTSLAQALQRYWQAAGIKTVLEGAERPVVLKRVYSDYDFDATLQNYSTSGDPALGISRTYHTEAIKQGQSFNNATRLLQSGGRRAVRQGARCARPGRAGARRTTSRCRRCWRATCRS